MRSVVVATRNPAKVAALGRWMRGWELRPAPADIALDCPEDAPTFAENAMAKALAVSTRLPGTIVIASDGGLLVPALGAAWNPLRTHRFAGSSATPEERARALLRLAADLRGRDRAIGWHEALAVAVDGRRRAVWDAASSPGELATALHELSFGADPGFWVPTVWRCPEYEGRRLSDLTAEEHATRPDHWIQLGSALSAWLAEYD